MLHHCHNNGAFMRKTSIKRNIAKGRPSSFALHANLGSVHFWSALLLTFFLASMQLLAQTPVTTWHYNNARTGANTSESILTTSNVNYQTFGKRFTQPVDGFIVGHPLYLPGVSISGQGVHNVVYVATMHDSVYAFDADSALPAPLWTTSLLDYSAAGASTMSSALKNDFNPTAWPELGIVSTPVIDPTTGTIYLVAETYENAHVVHRLHALDVTTGQEKFGAPVTIAASSGQNGITTTFQDYYQMNRPGLLLANGHVYIAWGSNGNNTLPCQGWVLSYNATTLEQEGVFTTEPGQVLASIWQEGAGLSADSDGNIYAEDGEGYYAAGTNLSTSVMKLSQVGTELSLTDWFTPFIHQYLSQDDLDLTGGVVILPDQSGPVTHEAIGIGKQGTIYVLDRDNLGQLCSICTTTDTQIVQELIFAATNSGTPVYWNNTLYFAGLGVPVVAYSLNDGLLTSPFSSTSVNGGGSSPIITANGNSNGILWFVDGNHNLWALNATTLKMIYVNGLAPNGRDALGPLAHFATPIAADGEVFVGTQNSLTVYGLLPTLSVVGGGGQSGPAGSTLPAPLAIQAVDPYTHNVLTGVTVTFSDGGKGGSFNPATAITDENGKASTSYTLPPNPATLSLTASATGYASGLFSETATAKSSSTTTTTLVSSLNPSTLGQAVTLTATVTPSSGSIPNGEAVTFKTGTTVLSTGTTSGGRANITLSNLPVGTDSIVATYAGDATFGTSFATLAQQVLKDITTTTVSSALNPSNLGQAVTFTATVSSAAGSIPNGETLTFKTGTTVLGTSTLSGGTATFTVSTLAGGNDSVSAVYPGDANFRSSYGSVTQQVLKDITTTTVSSALNPSNLGQAVTFTATVSSAAGSIPNGETVTWKVGTTVLATSTTAGGTATMTLSSLPAGTDSITAVYAGDANFRSSYGSASQKVQ